MMNRSIFDYTKEELETFLVKNEITKFRATQIYEWLYRKLVTNFSDMTNIKKDTLAQIERLADFSTLEQVDLHIGEDKTKKFLFRLHDGHLIETVLMRQYYGNSVCVTTQVGCNMGCSFCASGTIKKQRNLTAAEIVLQVVLVARELAKENERVSHIVVMGIGEPFDNYENTMNFIRIINDPKGLEIGARHITVSTCGIVPKIKEFAHFPLQVNLAISLHFAYNNKRAQHMKINQRYPIEELLDAIRYYYLQTNRKITFEYILLHQINDTKEDAIALANLLKEFNCVINLIPYNETAHTPMERSKEETMHAFFDQLKKFKLNVTLRKELGHDINAACGQLKINKSKENQ